jgi:hypothetical protein
MKLWLIMLICLPLISMGSALDFTESISMDGEGGLYVRSNSLDGSDGASGIGNQNYTRTLSIGEDSSSLASNYNYKNMSQRGSRMYDNYTNYYYITGESSTETKHSISVHSNQAIESRGSVVRDGGSFLTNFEMKSDSGNLSETLSIKDGAKPIYIAEAKLDGNFSISSSASEDVERGVYSVVPLRSLSLY